MLKTKRSRVVFGISSLLAAALALAGTVFFTHSARAANPTYYHAQAHVHLKGALPTHPIHNPLLSTTLAQAESDENADPKPGLSALCQSFLGGTNPYAVPTKTVDMINGDTVVQAGSQTGCGSPQNETTITVNPNNPRNLVAGTNDYRIFNTREQRADGSGWAYATFDGGKTWKNVQVPHLTFQTGATGALSDMDSAGDPSLTFGPDNTVYYANLVFSRFNAGSGVVVSVSHDGGRTWGEPVIVHTDGVDANGNSLPTVFFNDKEWVAADQHGNVFVTWTHFTFTDTTQSTYVESPIVMEVSHDGGRTFGAMTFVSPAIETGVTGGVMPFGSGSNPVVGRNGELYVAYETAVCQTLACNLPTDHDATIVAKSTDRGATFTQNIVDTNFDFPGNPDTGRATLTGENFRINSFPQLTVDRETGRLWVTWADDRNGQYDANGNSIKTNGDVLVATSNNGKNWKESTLGSADDEVYPAIAANDSQVIVTYYTRHFDPTGINLDYAYSSVNGHHDDATVVKNMAQATVHRITEQSENPNVQFLGIGLVSGKVLQGEFIGDYTAVAMGSDGVAHPCWTDFRGNPGLASSPANLPNQDAYTARITTDE